MHKGFNERPEVKSNPSMDIAAMNRMVEWHPIGQTSNQLILYHPPSHALSVQPHPPPLAESSSTGLERSRRASLPSYRPRPLLLPYGERAETPIESIERQPEQELNTASCPYCLQPLPGGLDPFASSVPFQPTTTTNAYFRVLEQAHEGSRPPSPGLRVRSRGSSGTPKPGGRSILDPIAIDEGEEEEEEAESRDVPARGYYDRFFKEECRLGMGAEGSVYLATHVIGGNVLGTYAVKKIAVGDNKDYLVKMLREVRLLEALRHPNIIPYHHSWIDLTRFSSFGPPITALHVLMMYATAGNLDSFLLNRSNSKEPFKPDLSAGGIADSESLGQLPKLERIKAFKKRRQSGTGSTRKKEETRGVLLLGLEEIVKLFGDVVEGLAFLHANSILHLDLKCSNVLLHWEEGKLIPKAMISDFGTSEEMLRGNRERTGHTGTMEYMAPETLVVGANGHWRPSDSHADMWSLGMILHKLLFLHLPYTDTEDFDNLQVQILEYPGFVLTSDLIRSCERRHIPRDLLHLLSKLVHVNPESRPTAEKVRTGIRGITVKPASSGINGIVTRFIRPQNIDINATSPLSRDNIINTAEYSPVRPMLALPSPILETAPSVSPTLPKWTTAHLTDQHKTMIHTGLFVLKVLSLQSSITGINPPPFAAVLLLAGALVSLFMATWGIELASTTVHVALLVAIRQKVTMEVINCVQPM